MKKTNPLSGNMIVMLFAAIGMAGVVTYGLNNVMRGPAMTTAELSRKTMAENTLIATTRLAVTAATKSQTNEGDCDSDGFIEPIAWRDAGVLPKPTGGGLVPSNIGASMGDPWGTQYGYCVWDAGSLSVSNAVAACGGATPRRLQGAPKDDQYAVSVISAGPNGVFETSCNAFVDTTPADGKPDTAMLNKPGSSDDIVLSYTYAEANGIGGGEWKVKSSDATTAAIAKNIEVGGGAQFTGALALTNKGLVLPGDPGNNSVTGACDASKEQQIRRNTSTAPPTIEICDFAASGAWVPMKVGDSTLDDTQCEFSSFTAQASSSRPWTGMAMSADGSKIIAPSGSVGVGLIFTSPDGGITWGQRTAPASNWYFSASSADGTKLAATIHGGQIYTSSDSGATWTARESSRNWRGITASQNGNIMYAVGETTQVYKSTDAGVTWTALPAAGTRDWYDVATSANGLKVVATAIGGQIYTSTNGGTSWTARESNRQWRSVVSSSDGANLAATVSAGYIYTSIDSGATWTQRGSIGGWNDLAGSADGGVLAAVAGNGRIFISKDAGATWKTYDSSRSWTSIVMSANGKRIAASVSNGQIYTGACGTACSFDVWTPRDSNRHWRFMASSSDGVKQVATSTPGKIYTTADTGKTWVPRDADRQWYFSASSSDGVKLAATAGGGQIYTSTDSGATWTARDSARSWRGITSSADGVKLAALGSLIQIYTSADSGATWTARDSAREWFDVASSADGARLVATAYGGQIYTSSNSGVAWTARDSARNWTHVASSSTGEVLAALVSPGQIYISQDYGVTWTARESARNWADITMSSDGSKLAAAVSGGNIYISSDFGITWLPKTSSRTWSSIVSSANGMNLTAAVVNGQVYTSSCAASDTPDPVKPETLTTSLDDGLVAHWKMDEVTGTTVKDSVGSNNGTFVNTPTWLLGPQGNSSLSFAKGDSDAIRISGLLGAPASITLAGWFNVNSMDTSGYYLLDMANNFGLAFSPTYGLHAFYRNGGSSYRTATVANPGPFLAGTGWHYIVVTLNGSQDVFSLYVDGTLYQSTSNAPDPNYPLTGDTWIGRYAAGNDFDLDGGVDDVRFYNRALGPAEVKALSDRAKNQTLVRDLSPLTVSVDKGDRVAVPEQASGTICMIKDDKSLWCTGSNNVMQLGTTKYAATSIPVAVEVSQAPYEWVSVSAGGSDANPFNCAIKSDGTAWCWGSNSLGELGNGTTVNKPTPELVSGGLTWSQISAAAGAVCGITTVGTLYCWGTDSTGQLGNGANPATSVPEQVGTDIWKSVSAAYQTACGIKADDSAWCWGADSLGQIGNGSVTTGNQVSPVVVDGGKKWARINAGWQTTCGITTDGAAWCWGDNASGQLGNGTTTASTVPVKVLGDRRWSDISAGRDMVCGITTDGAVWCWGDDTYGQLGNGTSPTDDQLVPSRVLIPGPVFSLSAGENGVCAMETNGALWCWGTDVTGRLGNGPVLTAYQYSPSRVVNFPNAALWQWNTAHDALTIGSGMIAGLGNQFMSADGTDAYFGFLDPGKALFYQSASGSNLVIETTAATSSAQVNLRKADPDVAYADYATGLVAKWNSTLTGATYPATNATYDGTLTGTAYANGNGGTNAGDSVVEFDSSKSARVSVANAAALRPANITLVAWIKTKGDQTTGSAILSKAHTSNTGAIKQSYALQFSNSQTIAFLTGHTGGFDTLSAASAIRPHSWVNVMATYNGTTGAKKLYINGVLSSSKTISSNIAIAYDTAASGNLFIGAAGCATLPCQQFNGGIADLRIFNTELTAAQVKQLYDYDANTNDGAFLKSYAVGIDHAANNLEFARQSASTDLLSALTPNLAVTATGNIGIGGASPSSRVEVNGGVRIGYQGSCSSAATGTMRYGADTGEYPNCVPDFTTWTSRDSSRAWRDVAASSDGMKLVAAHFDPSGRLYTSTDGGATWTARGSSLPWRGVASSSDGTKLVATGFPGQIYTSTDSGVTWTARETSRNWSDVASSADGVKLVAVALSGQIYTSTDSGVTWTARESSRNWYSVASSADGTKLAAVVGAGGQIYVSTDSGVTWTAKDSVRSWYGITSSADGTKLAATVNGGHIYTSSDSGATWSPRETNRNWFSIASSSDGTILAAVGTSSNTYISTDSGLTWVGKNSGPSNFGVALSSDGKRIVTTGNGNYIYTSSAVCPTEAATANSSCGVSWEARTASEANNWYDVTYGNNIFVAVSGTGTNRVMTSSDGITWTARSAAAANAWRSVTYGNGLFVAVSDDGTNQVMTSPDGTTWTSRTTPALRQWRSVIYANGIFLAISKDPANSRPMTSLDGINWTFGSITGGDWESLAYGNGMFVTVSPTGSSRVATSTDGVNWIVRTPAATNAWYSVAFGNGTFVALSYDGTNRVMTSPDGITWTSRSASENLTWSHVTFGAGLFVAVGQTGTNRIMTSPDGITWTARAAPEANSWESVVYGNGMFVGVAYSGTNRVMTSLCPLDYDSSTPWKFCNGTDWVAFPSLTGSMWKKMRTSITAGDSSSCAVNVSGKSYCWGAATNGRLGDNQTAANRLTPVLVHTNSATTGWGDWTQISTATNGAHSCGIRANGTAWCWGAALNGKLGDNQTATDRSRPILVHDDATSTGWSDWTQISVGVTNHTCGIRANGTAWCWGASTNGRLGDNQTAAARLRPVKVHDDVSATGWSDWIAISSGAAHTCGIRTNGTAWCWGAAANGRLGDNQTAADRLRPVKVHDDATATGWSDWISISAGNMHTCGIRANGTAWCWGAASNGKIGDNTSTERLRPVLVHDSASSTGWTDWVSISAGFEHTCGVRTNGTAWCWGAGANGRLGDNQTAANRLRPVQVLQ